MNMPINYRELVGDPIYGKGLTEEYAAWLDDRTFGYRVSDHSSSQIRTSPETRTQLPRVTLYDSD